MLEKTQIVDFLPTNEKVSFYGYKTQILWQASNLKEQDEWTPIPYDLLIGI